MENWGKVNVPHPRFSGADIERRGEEIYERSLRSQLEAGENIGKIASIDIETGEYVIDSDAAIYAKRIGYNAVYAVGGSSYRTSQ